MNAKEFYDKYHNNHVKINMPDNKMFHDKTASIKDWLKTDIYGIEKVKVSVYGIKDLRSLAAIDINNLVIKYGRHELPQDIADFIKCEALKLAGWQLIDGEWSGGSIMFQEWITFTKTLEEWIQECYDHGIILTDDEKQRIRAIQ